MIIRNYYLDKISRVKDVPLIKVILGMRRVGKSTIMTQVIDNLISNGIESERIIYINFERLANIHLKDYLELNEYIHQNTLNTSKHYIFLDEIQEVDNFEKLLASLLAEDCYDIYVTGSNSKLLSGELATYLTGRTYSINIFPLSFKELFEYDKPDDKELYFFDYVRKGGMPLRLQFNDDEIFSSYLDDVYKAILYKDIVKRYGIRDLDLFNRFMLFINQNIGQTFSSYSITKFLKSEGRNLSKETIYNYLTACESAYLTHSIPRYNLRGKSLLKTNEKHYINDLGIRNIYFNNQIDIGQSLENIILIELLRRGYLVYVGKYNEYEIDFITKKNHEIQYFQVAYLLNSESTIEREFRALEKINDNHPKYVLSLDKIDFSRNGIQHKNIIDFLLE